LGKQFEQPGFDMQTIRRRLTLSTLVAAIAALSACGGGGDAVESTASAAAATEHALSGGGGGGGSGGGSGGGGGGAGGGGSAVALQIAGLWRGAAHYDPALSTLRVGTPLDRSVGLTLTEDAAGNLAGTFVLEVYTPWIGMPPVTQTVLVVGTASSKSMSVNVPVSFYGGKEAYKMSDGGTAVCADGSIGKVLSGTFNSKDANGSGSGTVALDNCPVI
jgi:hypothetical protein